MKLPKRFGKEVIMAKVTIADVAKKANVSLSTASYALNNKSGVGEKTRERILQLAKEMNYQPNAIASSLKRSSFNILISIPSLTKGFEYFFSDVDKGIEAYVKQLGEYKIKLFKAPYEPMVQGDQVRAIKEVLDVTNIDGIITNGQSDDVAHSFLNELFKAGTPIVYVGGNNEEQNRLAFVAPHYKISGKTIAELISFNLKEDDNILILCGNRSEISHYKVVEGFDEYLKQNDISNKVIKLYADNDEDRDIKAVIERENITVCCAVGARVTNRLGSALSSLDKHLYAIGSDLFAKSRSYLEEGVFDVIIQKNPYKASYFATQILCNKIIKNQEPKKDEYYTSSEIIIRANLPLYTEGIDKIIF